MAVANVLVLVALGDVKTADAMPPVPHRVILTIQLLMAFATRTKAIANMFSLKPRITVSVSLRKMSSAEHPASLAQRTSSLNTRVSLSR